VETFVLINGAWHGGWAWRPVAQQLRGLGHRVHTPTLPGLADGDDPSRHSLADVVDFVVDYVEQRDLTDITLLGHSWGGYVITGAAPRLDERLRKLVYWSAFVPEGGKSLVDEVPEAYRDLFRQLAESSPDKTVTMPLEIWQEAFIQDAPEAVQRQVWQLLVAHPYQYFTETVTPLPLDTFRTRVSYVLSIDDLALPPGEYGWHRFAERLGVEPINAPGSHEGCFTQPEALAKAFLSA
jgi:pimeloyl-ACP methyl ester carboxylesterase